jgi:hypothetical protein
MFPHYAHFNLFGVPQQFYSPDDVNSTAPRPEPDLEWPEGDELPEQFGGARSTLMPGIYLFQTPSSFDGLWKDIAIEDGRKTMPDGTANPNYKQKVARKQIRFDRNHPLVVVGGPHDGDVMTWNCSTNPRVRGRKDDPKSPWISDAAYLHTIALADKTRVKSADELKAAINSHAGAKIRLETGLSGQCRPDRVRRICLIVTDPATGQQSKSYLDDPSGQKGCGARFYTDDFRNPQTGKYDLEVGCDCGQPTAEEAVAGKLPVNVVVRGFESVERILPPL